MDISNLVNPVSDAPQPPPARRSLSLVNDILAPSPTVSSANLPTPSPQPRPMSRKRKRYEEKPIWAVREDELYNGQTLQEHIRQIQQANAASAPEPRPQPPSSHAPPVQAPQRNGHAAGNGHAPAISSGAPQTGSAGELVGFERPVSDDAHVYDGVSRKVCDFIWNTVVDNEIVRRAIAESPDVQVEIEARWGQLKDRRDGMRINTPISTEGVVKATAADNYSFESTMTIDQHKAMNMYLNSQVQKSKAPDALRATVNYEHTREIDQFFELNQTGFDLLPPTTRQLIAEAKKSQKIRVTRDAKTPSNVLRALVKLRIANLEIASPQTEWDYRIGVNLEINFPGPLADLKETKEPGKTSEELKRYKDRVSYSLLGAYQIDLTQVIQASGKNHELELELDSEVVLKHADDAKKGLPNRFENIINGMMNNLRVLSREITPPGVGA